MSKLARWSAGFRCIPRARASPRYRASRTAHRMLTRPPFLSFSGAIDCGAFALLPTQQFCVFTDSSLWESRNSRGVAAFTMHLPMRTLFADTHMQHILRECGKSATNCLNSPGAFLGPHVGAANARLQHNQQCWMSRDEGHPATAAGNFPGGGPAGGANDAVARFRRHKHAEIAHARAPALPATRVPDRTTTGPKARMTGKLGRTSGPPLPVSCH